VAVDIAAGRASRDPVQQAFTLEEAFGAEDPDFEYEVELLRRELPEPAISEGHTVTLMLRDGPRTLKVGTRPRDAAAGPAAVWAFAENSDGHAARQAAMLATARGDQEVAIESGLVVELRNAPKVMRDAFEQTRPEDREGRFVFKPGPGLSVGIAAYLPSGDVSSRELSVYPFPPAHWEPIGEHDRAFVGLDGALMPFFGLGAALLK